jgi:hypothetical protein
MMRGLRLTFALLLVCAVRAAGQYEEPVDAAPPAWRYLWAGAAFRTFEPLSSNTAPGDIQISYQQVMPTLGLRQDAVDLSLGYASFTQRGESHESIIVTLLYSFPFPLTRSGPTTLILPVLLGADYTKAEATGPERNTFNVASVGVGTGLEVRHRVRAMELSVRAGGLAHYSTEAYNFTGGFSAAVIGEAAFLFPRIGILDGLAVGYRVRYQMWSMSNETFNYATLAHGPFVGVML